MTSPDLYARLMNEALAYDPQAHQRNVMDPFREVILLQRAKFISYERIARIFNRNGVKVSGCGVRSYCRRTFNETEILRERLRFETEISAPQPRPLRSPEGSPRPRS